MYKDDQDYKANLGCDLVRLLDHSFLSFKIVDYNFNLTDIDFKYFWMLKYTEIVVRNLYQQSDQFKFVLLMLFYSQNHKKLLIIYAIYFLYNNHFLEFFLLS